MKRRFLSIALLVTLVLSFGVYVSFSFDKDSYQTSSDFLDEKSYYSNLILEHYYTKLSSLSESQLESMNEKIDDTIELYEDKSDIEEEKKVSILAILFSISDIIDDILSDSLSFDSSCIRTVGNAELIKCDDDEIVIESNGMPEHDVMIGIAEGAWNGQWPEAQDYTGDNAFVLSGTPTLASTPTIVVSNAAGVAANGIPIFLPQSPGKEGSDECLDIEVTGGVYDDGECIRDPVVAGEMDFCGGHTGRGNDYHYHGTPECLIEELADDEIVGYMLDGIAIYSEIKDGSEEYADCGGYVSPEGEVYYVFTDEYPYVTNCLLGEFSEGPRTQGSEVDTGGIDDKNAGSITNYYVDSSGCAHMTFSKGETITHCFDDHSSSSNTQDSGQKKYCGDNICDNTESYNSCPTDCSN